MDHFGADTLLSLFFSLQTFCKGLTELMRAKGPWILPAAAKLPTAAKGGSKLPVLHPPPGCSYRQAAGLQRGNRIVPRRESAPLTKQGKG